MNNVRGTTSFLIVQSEEKRSTGENIIELVLQTWVSTKNGYIVCRYPDTTTGFEKIRKLIQRSQLPMAEWTEYPVEEILHQAHDHEQGIRRLKRALKGADLIASTDTESLNTPGIVSFLSVDSIAACLEEQMPVVNETADMSITHIYDELKHFIQDKFEEFEIKLSRKFEATKRSILYDVEKKTADLKLAILQDLENRNLQESDPSETLQVELPIRNLETFLEFEALHEGDPDKQNASKRILSRQIIGLSTVKEYIAKTMQTVIGKPVELNYIASGRKSKNMNE